ncbi:serine/threonine-protein kinase [Victivallis sp. Marseille-Q1083]|uniref:serine/threonine protein kinase n=1 Tax=Victivallis sp. Marseille-Q1083 TaxID=2717288 RepID=UPI00158EC7AE|nr:serine/threonine-protein kinase [Victivallis sp. Marseille-Q1083]
MKKIISKVEYEIVNLIGEGGMGAVYKAKAKGVAGFEKIVAIKTLLAKYVDDATFVTRFIAEAKLVANLIHENIVQIYQLNREHDGYYFILEFVDGISLYDFMEYHRKFKLTLPYSLAVFITSRVARGLAYAHSRLDGAGNPLDIVHCDVCPHNILINIEGVPKLTDFGIAKAANLDDDGKVSGKVAFMAPEQATRHRKVDFRADIYSLGIVLFYLLSNRMARHIEKTVPEILEQARENFIDWERLPKDLPPELLDILHKMLAADPRDRYNDTAVLARDLEYYIYKDGYGPTIVTLANYMRELLPARFGAAAADARLTPPPGAAGSTAEIEKTAVMAPEAAAGGTAVPMEDRTVILSQEELNALSQFSRGRTDGAHDGRTLVLSEEELDKRKAPEDGDEPDHTILFLTDDDCETK